MSQQHTQPPGANWPRVPWRHDGNAEEAADATCAALARILAVTARAWGIQATGAPVDWRVAAAPPPALPSQPPPWRSSWRAGNSGHALPRAARASLDLWRGVAV
ncbi:MAG: hypothetical protein LBP52_05885 [Burkholderiaceae bacterium]|nr:hypothetical protein [Burkholderiaceae bacterium]